MSEYEDMLNLKRPQYPDLPPMSIHDRAAQFSPFAALVGYEDAVAETERLTDRKREMSEEEIRDLNEKLQMLEEMIQKRSNAHCPGREIHANAPDDADPRCEENAALRPYIRVLYFEPDKKKEGGRYVEKEGALRTIDSYNRMLVFSDGEKIPIDRTYCIQIS